MGLSNIDNDTWKWAPVILLSPLPWAVISLVVMAGGQVVMNGAETYCVDPSGNAVDTGMMVTGVALAITSAYMFLFVFAWTWLGHAVHVNVPAKREGHWGWKSVCVAKPFKKLSHIAYIYAVIGVVSILAAGMCTGGVAYAAAICAVQTPMLVSFSTFCFIIFWVAMGVTLGRLFTVAFGHKVAAGLKKAGVVGDGDGGTKSDVDMVKVIFKQFDTEGEGYMESSQLGALLELLGMKPDAAGLQEILVSW